MSALTVVILIFSGLGLIDKLLGDRFGMGKEFERAFSLFCPMAMTMLGMLVLAPAIGTWLTPLFDGFYNLTGMDPSVIPAALLANDMGGTSLAQSVCKSVQLGGFNAFVVSSMMGCVISFTIPFAIGMVKKSQHPQMFFGLICGIVTIPVGCFVSGLMCGIGVGTLLWNLLPLVVVSVLMGAGLVLAPDVCIKVVSWFGAVIKTVSLVGLACGIFTFLTKTTINPHFDSFENAAMVCVNASVTLSGALPAMYLVSKALDKPLHKLARKTGLDSCSMVTLLSTIVTNSTTFSCMERMNNKGVVLNSAFAVSAAFTFGSHMAFTMAFDDRYVAPMIVGKMISGICALVLALVLYRDKEETKTQ